MKSLREQMLCHKRRKPNSIMRIISNRFWQSILMVLILLLLVITIPGNTTFAQSSNGEDIITIDGAVNPQVVEVNEPLTVQLSVIAQEGMCESIVTQRPMDIILVTDRSPSMDQYMGSLFGGTKLEAAIQAIETFIDNIDPSIDRISIVAFSQDASALNELGNSQSARDALQKLKKGEGISISGTNMQAGVEEAQKALQNNIRSDASQVIVLLSDGNFGVGGDPTNDIEQAKENDVRVVTIGLGPDTDEFLMRNLASQASDYYFAPEPSELESIYESIAQSIKTFDYVSDLQVQYTFDASNFGLDEESISPSATVDVNKIIWDIPRLEGNQQILAFELIPRVPGKYQASMGIQYNYISCNDQFLTGTLEDKFPVEVIDGSTGAVSPICLTDGSDAGSGSPFWIFVCNKVPWFWLGLLLIGIPLLLFWLLNNAFELRSWRRCGLPVSACTWAKIPLYAWLAILAGLIMSALASSVCSPREGITFWRILPDRSSAIYVKSLNPDIGSQPITPLASESDCMGCHTTNTNSQAIAGITKGTNGALRVYDLQGSLIEIPDIQGSYPAWSPDGTKLAYAANNEDIYILDMVTEMTMPLEGASNEGVVETMPAWSTDGKTIAFTRAAGYDQNSTITVPCDILTVPVEGGTATLLPGASGIGFNYHPSYSPDGKWLAYTHHENGETTYGEPLSEIFIVPAQGGAPRRLQANDGPGGQQITEAGNTWPTWSNDGSTLYFSSRRCDDQYDIYETTIDGDGNSSPAKRVSTVSDPQAFEYGAQEVTFLNNPLYANLLDLLPFVLVLLLLLLINWLLCRTHKLKKEEPTIKVEKSVKPAEGWLRRQQQFRVNLEMRGLPGCQQRRMLKNIDAVLVIDVSYSMDAHDMGTMTRIAAAKRAATRFVRCVIGKEKKIAIVTFSDDAKIQHNFSQNEKDLVNKIKSIGLEEGGTNMGAGLRKAYELLTASGCFTSKKVIILLTDGAPTHGEDSVKVAQLAKDAGIRIMTVGIGEANAQLLTQVATNPNDYKYVTDNDDLLQAFLQAGQILLKPVSASEITYVHRYDIEKFSLIPGSIVPAPDKVEPGLISWVIGSLDEMPLNFRYSVSPKVNGENYIDLPGEISYKRCGKGSIIRMPDLPEILVNVRSHSEVVYKEKKVLPDPIEIVPQEIVWQPDKALFIGVGGAGRWVLTHIRKNLVDAGAGNLPEGVRFLLLDTDEYEKIKGEKLDVDIGGVEIPTESILRESETVLLIDTSSSVLEKTDDGRNQLQYILKAIKHYVRKFTDEKQKIALVTFGDDAEVCTDFLNYDNEILEKVNQITAAGSSNMSAGLKSALELFESEKTNIANKHVVLLSASEPDNPEEVKKIADVIKERKIKISCLAFAKANISLMREITSSEANCESVGEINKLTESLVEIGEKIAPALSSDIFVLDENLQSCLSKVNQKDLLTKGWISDPQSYEGMERGVNLSNGTYGKRIFPRLALLRLINRESGIQSKWLNNQAERNRFEDIYEWIDTRCKDVFDDDQIRIFVAGSLVGGMGGTLMDISLFAKNIAEENISESGSVVVEGYFVDGVPYRGLAKDQEIGTHRMANCFAGMREMSRWQLRSGYEITPGWSENKKFSKAVFNNITLYSAPNNQLQSDDSWRVLKNTIYPAIADTITTRLDKAAAAGGSAALLNSMSEARQNREESDRVCTVANSGIYSYRFPVTDILKMLHVKWADKLIRTFLTGQAEKAIDLSLENRNDPSFPDDPSIAAVDFLDGQIGGEANPVSQLFASLLYDEQVGDENLTGEEIQNSLSLSDDNHFDGFNSRVGETINHMLRGSEESDPNGARFARLLYANQFIESLELKLSSLQGKLVSQEYEKRFIEIIDIYQQVTTSFKEKLSNFRNLLTVADEDEESIGLVQYLDAQMNYFINMRDYLDQISCRSYIWGGTNEEQVEFIDLWWQEYLDKTFNDHLGYLDMIAYEDELDLLVRIKNNQVSLVKDGNQAILNALENIASQLTKSVWKDVSLTSLLEQQKTFVSDKNSEVIGRMSKPYGEISSRGDPGIPMDRLMIFLPKGLQEDIKENSDFYKSLKNYAMTQGRGIEIGRFLSTDRYSCAFMQIRDAVRLDRLEGFEQANKAYDQYDGWDGDSFNKSSNDLSVMRAEGEARSIEMNHLYDYKTFGYLHPFVVNSLQSPAKAELFCLAYAEGLIYLTGMGQLVCEVEGQTIELIKRRRGWIDIKVDGLLRWVYEKDHSEPEKWQYVEGLLRDRYRHIDETIKTNLFAYLDQFELKVKRLKMAKDGTSSSEKVYPDEFSFYALTDYLVKNFLNKMTRRWENE